MRIRLLQILVALCYFILICQLINLAVFRSSYFRELADKNCIRFVPQQGGRGKILDANNKILVTNRLSYDVLILPQSLFQITQIFEKLSFILQISPEQLMEQFKRNYTEPSVPVCVAKNIGLDKAVQVEESKLNLEGVIVQTNVMRYYPYEKIAAHILGHLGQIDVWRLSKLASYGYKAKDIVGVGGIEERYDYYLRQQDGGISIEVDHQGRFSRLLSYFPPRNGKDIGLTIDLRIQRIVEEILDNYIGSIVIIEPNTGAVLAMASRPDFSPLSFLKSNSPKLLSELFNNPYAPLTNRAIQGQYPPGSVFKPLVATAALELNKINSATTFNCPGFLRIGRRDFKCWAVHNEVDLIKALAQSCDVFFYKLGLAIGPAKLHEFADKFGLGQLTGVELPYEAKGNIPHPLLRKMKTFQRWYDGDTANFAIGQGAVLVTPLQMVRAIAVFANGGQLVRPYLVRSIDQKDVSSSHQKIEQLPLKKKYLELVRRGLREVVANPQGTAHVLANLPVSVAGKTGTAEAPGGTHAWFVGFFPFEKPQFCAAVFLENGGHGAKSASLLKEIIERMIEEGIILP
ncbi:MAG: penicillin-binding protein 2 [Candidatus Omnitrophica bacterium]|nr:penicillin-binding protein 2 [Candidatus Omnitrophota bacterium]